MVLRDAKQEWVSRKGLSLTRTVRPETPARHSAQDKRFWQNG